MSLAAPILLGALLALALFYIARWTALERREPGAKARLFPGVRYSTLTCAIGFVTDFFDTLGIGAFAPTTSVFKLVKLVPDERIPGTLNAGHALPTVVEALIFIAVVAVDPVTLVLMIAAAVLGAWQGAGVVARLPRRAIQVGMGLALAVAAVLFVLANLKMIPGGGTELALQGSSLAIGVAVNFLLGALMTLGVGLYAPCLILVSLLGLNPIAAFPIMMGSCAFLMPVAGLRFIAARRYDLPAAFGLALGGLPGVLIAAFIVKQLPLVWLRWLVVVVVLYAAVAMLRASRAVASIPGEPDLL
ncbi:MAG: sulfite exporter TauE/SafE family protein [Sinobacteraceae bacterium]|nr:sulfite exporter TauE/SafE family protein [Nevskiaceae bacterium]